jgi:YVTN family beta-propeller protein
VRRLMAILAAVWLAAVAGAGPSLPAPPAQVTARIKVGPGAGVPAVDRGAVWVPNTRDGSVSRVDTATTKVVATIKLGAPPRFQGYVGDEIDRIDPRTNRLVARIKVESRPGGLTVGAGYVWAFHFSTGGVTRIDVATGEKKVFTVPGAFGTGIAYAAGAIWLLSVQPASLFKLDPETGAIVARVAVAPSRAPKHGLIDTWWIAAGGGSVWLANPNHDLVTRVDVATAKVAATVPVPVEIPFGVVVGRGAVWVAGAGRVARINPATNRVTGVVTLSKRSVPIFTQVAIGPAGLWATDYKAGILYRIRT